METNFLFFFYKTKAHLKLIYFNLEHFFCRPSETKWLFSIEVFSNKKKVVEQFMFASVKMQLKQVNFWSSILATIC